MKRMMVIAFAVVCLIQLAVPAWMIHRRENTLRHGEAFRFKTQPVDPYDAFRGRYVALNFEAATFTNRVPDELFNRRRQTMYASIDNDADGFAQVTALHRTRPATGSCIQVKVWNRSRLQFPFDRFYLEESLAPKAESLYREHNRRGATNTYAIVRVLGGFATLEDLIIDGRPVLEYATDEMTSP